MNTLEIIDMRLNLFTSYYISFRASKIAKGDMNIGSFDQWLCWNRYSSLVFE